MAKKKATATQLRNLAKGRKKLAAMRKRGKVTRKKKVARRPRSRKRNPSMDGVPLSHEAWELILYAENTYALNNQKESIIKNVIRKINNRTYDAKKAPRLWQYWMDSAAKSYTKEHGSGRGYGIFTPAIRREAGEYLARSYKEDITNREYEHLLPIKRKPFKKKAARKKNPARGNFLTARNVLKTGRTTNPVRALKGIYYVCRGSRYFTGYSFSGQKTLAVHYTSLGSAKAAAQKLADKTGSNIRIVDARK